MADFWKDAFMKRVQVKATGEKGTIIDVGSIEGTYIVEMDNPGESDIYPVRDYRCEDLAMESEAMAV